MAQRRLLTTLTVATLAAVPTAFAQPVQPLFLTSIAVTQQLAAHLALPAASTSSLAGTLTPEAAGEAAPASVAPLVDPTEPISGAAPGTAPGEAGPAIDREPADRGEYGVEYELSSRDAGSFLNRLAERAKRLVEQAMTYLGTPYRRGGASRRGVDCSGLVGVVYGQQGLDMPRTAAEQFALGTPVVVDDLRPGDLVFFRDTYKRGISHVGIYVGDGRFVHAAGHRRGTIVSELSRPYYRARYAGARRPVPLAAPQPAVAAGSVASLATAGAAAVEADSAPEPVEPASAGRPSGR
jgi:cell wall-associated NlpC family hydrolase